MEEKKKKSTPRKKYKVIQKKLNTRLNTVHGSFMLDHKISQKDLKIVYHLPIGQNFVSYE